ncbi:GNAT family N-acetyltransferase [Piscinibacter sp.]|uniref:GNAT family N-acetyltransferase n=1 Tax=Piscinibacter sp. TaxID=1903157 RepID=UPI002BDBF99B|nr:GNAT family N-acetyltransferase [Albitalea sp.]HUG23373.1 GNAT family N-acetyltransferase [Albitalea sp.]
MPTSPSRLYLRPFEHTDAPDFAAAARESVATVGRWMPWCHAAYSEAEAHAWFDACHRGSAERSAFEFGIFEAQTDRLLGGAGLNQLDMQHNLCNLGYWVRESMQRRGIATRTARALSELGFRELGLTRIEIVAAQGNEASCSVARKAGALFEGVARNRLVIGGTPVPASVFSLVP